MNTRQDHGRLRETRGLTHPSQGATAFEGSFPASRRVDGSVCPRVSPIGAILFLLCMRAFAADPPPLLVFVGAEAPQIPGWETLAVQAAPDDAGVLAIESAVTAAQRDRKTDPLRTYLAGQGIGVPTVFYAASRRPDLWAAALAFGGSPKPAIDSGRVFGANTQLLPFLWVIAPDDRAAFEPILAKLAAAEFNLAPQSAGLTPQGAFAWLAAQKRDAYPLKVDCETGTAEFARCYWAEITRFDPTQRNDVLPSTRVRPGSGAGLDLGGFGYKLDAPGPGVTVEWLPTNYNGPLRLGDRIVSVAGREIKDPRDYADLMDQATAERRVGIMLQRGKERVRLETKIALPKRAVEAPPARLQAQFLLDSHELLLITRGVGQARLTLPEHWVPCSLNWNGNEMGKASAPGCYQLTWGGRITPCPTQN